MPIEFLYIFLALSLFFSILALAKSPIPALSIVAAFLWWLTAFMMFKVDTTYAFYNVTSGQIVEYTVSTTDGWMLSLVFFACGFIWLVYFIFTEVFKADG